MTRVVSVSDEVKARWALTDLISETLRTKWDESKHPRHPAGSPQSEGGEFAPAGGGSSGSGVDESDKPINTAGQFQLARLRNQWAYLDKQLFQYTNEHAPTDPVVKKLVEAQLNITDRIHAHHLAQSGTEGGGALRDVVVVGAGPAGISAGIYGSSEGLNTLVVEGSSETGGQAGTSSRIENVMGFPVGVSGGKLAQDGVQQAKRLGAEVQLNKQVTGLSYDEKTGLKTLSFADGSSVQAHAVIIAGGVQFKKVAIPGADCPDVVYGSSSKLKERCGTGDAIVVGGANSAGQAAMDTAITSRHVTLLARSGIDNMSAYLKTQIEAHPRITVMKSEITEIHQDASGRMTGAVMKDGAVLPAKGVLYAIGSRPETDWAAGVERDKHGFIKVGGDDRADLETNIPGVFAAGDVRAGSIHRVIIAAADGAAAVSMTHGYLDKIPKGEKGLDVQRKSTTKVKDKDKDEATAWLHEVHRYDEDEQTYTGYPSPDEGVKPPTKKTKDFDESKHPRGQPENAGQFGPGGGGAASGSAGTGAAAGGGKSKGEHPGKGYSKDAYVDKRGVIQTNNVDDAARALHEDRRVNLKQPREVATLLTKLGEIAKEMTEKGEKAPNFNLCNVSVSGTNLFCTSSKGIPRIKMPQLSDEQTQEFPKWLESKGYEVTRGTELAANLRATQDELNGAKVAGTAKYFRDNPKAAERPIIVSEDGYILDGHHTWAAKIGNDAADGNLKNDARMNIIRVRIPTIELLHRANQFTGKAGRKPAIESKYQRPFFLSVKWDESKHPRHPGGSSQGGEFAPAEGSDDELGSMALGGEDRFITPSTRKVDALRNEMGVTAANVPFEQRQALDMYTQNSNSFNHRARLGSGSDSAETENLDKLVNSHRLPHDVTVYRTVGWQRTKNILDHIGDSFSDPAYMSTTLDKSKTDKPGSYIEIQVPKGSQAFPVGSLSNFPEEAEILFPRDSRLQIISHEPRGADIRFVARLVS